MRLYLKPNQSILRVYIPIKFKAVLVLIILLLLLGLVANNSFSCESQEQELKPTYNLIRIYFYNPIAL